jgi:hypothetical protein
MKDHPKKRSKRYRPVDQELDRAFLAQDRWLKAVLLPAVVIIAAALLLSKSPGSPAREFLIGLVFVSLAAALGLLVLWLMASVRYRRILSVFQSARGSRAYGPEGVKRLTIYAAAVLVSGGLGVFYFATPQWRNELWLAFVAAAGVFGGWVWTNRKNG